MMKKIYHEVFAEYDTEAFYEVRNNKLSYITGWHMNDACWRSEYMNGLLNHFDIMVHWLPKTWFEEAERLMRIAKGFDNGQT